MLEKAYGYSAKGKNHIRNKMPNQDSYLVVNKSEYTLAVVCDGLGSKKHSKTASKRLCKIIAKEVNQGLKSKKLNPIGLVETVQKKFKKKIWPFNLSNCDTTCLFSLISQSSILMFQTGDGLNALVSDNELIKCEVEEKDFTNETIAFGKSKRNNWKFKMIKKEENKSYKLLLCTDGLSEDIIEDSTVELINTLVDNISGKYNDNQFIKDTIDNWPNKYGGDDKTMVVIK